MLKSCAIMSVTEIRRGDQVKEPRTSPSKREAEARLGTDLRNYFRSVGRRTLDGEHLTQEDIAKEMGVSEATVNKWLSDYGFEAVTVYVEREQANS